jgi:hypothetical protein
MFSGHLGNDLGIDGKIIFRWVLKKEIVKVGSRFS